MAATPSPVPLPPAGPAAPPPGGAAAIPAPAGPAAGGQQQLAVTLALVGTSIVALYFGRDILIPIALSILLSFALAPPVNRLRRWGLPRVPAVLAVVLAAFLAIGSFGLVVGGQLAQLAQNLPSYQENVRAKIRSLRSAGDAAGGGGDGGIVGRTATMLEELSQELQESEARPPGSGPADAGETSRQVTIERGTPAGAAGVPGGGSAPGGAAARAAPAAPPSEPITVRVEEPPATPFAVIRDVAVPLLAPVGTAGIVVVFVIFILLERENLRDRLIRLVGGGDLNQTTQALDEAARRVSRYLLMQLVVNATYGIPVGVGLWLIGVPYAPLWGLLATVLRFVPYVGPFVGALFPLALALAVDPGWGMFLWTGALLLALELVSNNVIEPWLYGASTGISTVAILVAAVFWTTLWGPVGLLLSTPLTVCLAVVGRYAPQLGFLDVLLGSEPVLSPPERLYQRMLAGDPEEGEEIAEELLRDRPLAAFYDEVALPALRLAERDRHSRALEGERRALCVDSFLAVVGELADHEDDPASTAAAAYAAAGANAGAAAAAGGTALAAAADPAWAAEGAVACVAGRTGLDRAAAAMLAQLLGRRGIGARVLAADAASAGGAAGLDLGGARLVCLCYLGASAAAHARQACRRLRRAAPPGTPLMVGLLGGQLAAAGAPADPAAAAAGALGADLVAGSLAEAVERAAALAAAGR